MPPTEEYSMTWYADLSPCSYFGNRDCPDGSPSTLRSIGWLSADHPYTQGHVGPMERQRLTELMDDRWEFCVFCGSHTCELCLDYESHGNLFVPGDGVVFAAPEAILHYIDVHRYLPPSPFLDAVRVCPPMHSDEYFAALLNSGGKNFALMTGLIEEPTPCPYCSHPLITPKAKQCGACKTDWHDPTKPRRLRAIS